MTDPRLAALSSIKIESSRVEYCKSHIVLLCGGRSPEKGHPDDPTPSVQSLRHALETDLNNRIEFFKPEDVTNWQVDAIFRNLIDLEVELAAMCSLVVIILESPGAIAELGAFSQLKEFNDKIVAVCSEGHFQNDSFIKLGIFRHISNDKRTAVKSYPFEVGFPLTITAEIIEDVVVDVQRELDELPKSQLLKVSNSSHVFVLLYELIKLFVAVKESELLDYLSKLGVDVGRDQLRGKLFLLQRFRLISLEVYSDSQFYVARNSEFHRVNFAANSSVPIDKLRISTECKEFYNTSGKDNHRLRVIRRLFGGGK